MAAITSPSSQSASSGAALPSNDFPNARKWKILAGVVSYTAIGILGALAAVFLLVCPPAGVFALAAGFGVFLGAAGALTFGPPIFAKGGEAFPMGPRPDSGGASSQASSSSSSSSGSSSGSSSISSPSSSSSSEIIRVKDVRCEDSKPVEPRSITPPPTLKGLAQEIAEKRKRSNSVPSSLSVNGSSNSVSGEELESLKNILDAAGYDVERVPLANLKTLVLYRRYNGQEKMLEKLKRDSFLDGYLTPRSSSSSSSIIAPPSSVSEPSVQPPRPSLEELQKILKYYRVNDMPASMKNFLLSYLESYSSEELLDFVERDTTFDNYLTKEGEKRSSSKHKKSKKRASPSPSYSPAPTLQPAESSPQVNPARTPGVVSQKESLEEPHFFSLTLPTKDFLLYEPIEGVEEVTQSLQSRSSFFSFNSK